jgi:hypothetical protein
MGDEIKDAAATQTVNSWPPRGVLLAGWLVGTQLCPRYRQTMTPFSPWIVIKPPTTVLFVLLAVHLTPVACWRFKDGLSFAPFQIGLRRRTLPNRKSSDDRQTLADWVQWLFAPSNLERSRRDNSGSTKPDAHSCLVLKSRGYPTLVWPRLGQILRCLGEYW